jgi:hypothetical protein
MDPKIIIVIAAVVFVVAIAVAWYVARKRRTETLKSRFGPEYDRTVRDIGPKRAEADLLEREKRVEKFSIRELTADERERFVAEWRLVQTRFVDAPQEAVTTADKLVDRLMLARGYPVTDFEQRAADISVDHPVVVDNYRLAHQIALRHRRGEATTEDLRKAIIYYRSLFDDLLHEVSGHREVAGPRKEVA